MVVASLVLVALQTELTAPMKALHERGMQSQHAARVRVLKPEVVPMKDAPSYLVIWKSTPRPEKWVVSLPGSNGFATDDLAIWHRHLKDRKAGLISVQWWLGSGNRSSDYLTPHQIYREIDRALQNLEVAAGQVMLHGFSRGSANSYPLVALDQGRGHKYFGLCVASSGGVGEFYPPTAGIGRGEYGPEPLKGTKWVTVAGAQDANPDRDGIAGMRKAAEWLRKHGAQVVLSIEDESNGHGALVRNPENANKVLGLFLKS